MMQVLFPCNGRSFIKQTYVRWRTVWRFLKKLEIDMPYDPAIPLLGIHTELMEFLMKTLH